jgi:mRNA interferase MazF
MVRGSVIWVALDPARGTEIPKTRPCVVVSRDIASEVSPTVTVVPLSSLKGRAPERLVQPILRAKESRLPKDSRALCDQVRTVDKGRIQSTAEVLSGESMRRIDRGLILHLKLEDYVRTGPEQV